MKQFYFVKVPSGNANRVPIVFSQPVRKISVHSTYATALTLRFSDGSFSPSWLISPAATDIIDFQSANNGGDIDWYK